MNQEVANGTRREIDGTPRIHYEGYWVRYYEPPPETLQAKKKLIRRLTRRAFHHTEAGINTPGRYLDRARDAFLAEADPARKRVNAAMLAGALFNRATDIFTSIVNLEKKHVAVSDDNELMKQCGACLQEALELGKQVRHFSGHEGVDELWGEPMKAFTMSIRDFYDSRYIKIAWAMRDIDSIAAHMRSTAGALGFTGLEPLVDEYTACCKDVCDTSKADPENFRIWPRYVAAHEALAGYCRRRSSDLDLAQRMVYDDGYRVLREGTQLMSWIAGTRVPMPKSLRSLLDKCESIALRKRVLDRDSA